MFETAEFVPPKRADARRAPPRRYQMLVGGKSVAARDGGTIRRDSPAYAAELVAEIPEAASADVEAAIVAARQAFDNGPWPQMSGMERSRILSRIAEAIAANLEELALIECLEVGKAIKQARPEIAFSAELWRYAAGHAQGLTGETHNGLGRNLALMLREPAGVVGIITPWNYPLLIASERIPWALGAGCTVVVKPSELSSGSTIRVAELARDCGLPDGVFNVVTGYGDPAGQTLAIHPAIDVVSFTGSYRVGQIVGGLAAARIKRVGLELGGKGPQIVFADSDLDRAAPVVANSIFGGSGQGCISGSRLIIERTVRDEMLDRLARLAGELVIGDPLDERVDVGSLIHAAHLAKIEHYVADGQRAGAKLVVGGSRLGEVGSYFAPTIFSDVTPDMSIARDEIFGPVLSTLTFEGEQEAVALANDSIYGLSASVWSRDVDKAFGTIRRVRAGRTWINGAGAGAPELGIGGYKQSGLGRELGRYGFDEYSTVKCVYVAMA